MRAWRLEERICQTRIDGAQWPPEDLDVNKPVTGTKQQEIGASRFIWRRRWPANVCQKLQQMDEVYGDVSEEVANPLINSYYDDMSVQ